MLESQVLGFSIKVILNVIIGAGLLWFTESDLTVQEYSLGKLTGLIPDGWIKSIVEFLVFVGLGTYIALMFAHPGTSRQAFAAGIGWTASVSGITGRIKRHTATRQSTAPQNKTPPAPPTKKAAGKTKSTATGKL